jgi:hypothetical protein
MEEGGGGALVVCNFLSNRRRTFIYLYIVDIINQVYLIILSPTDRLDHLENLRGNIESQTANATQKMASRSNVGFWKMTVGEITAH